MAQRRRERTAPAPKGRVGEEAEYGIIMAVENVDRDGDAAAVGGMGEVSVTPGGAQRTEEGKGREGIRKIRPVGAFNCV